MNLRDFLSFSKLVFLQSRTKEEALKELVNSVCRDEPSLSDHKVLDAIMKREKIVSSRIASGISIPHARLPGLARFILAVGRSKEGIFYDEGDKKLVYLLIALPGLHWEVILTKMHPCNGPCSELI